MGHVIGQCLGGLVLIGLCLQPTIFAQDRFDMAVVTGYPPFAGEDLYKGGIVSDVVMSVLDEMDEHGQVEYMPLKRAYIKVSKGQMAAAFPFTKTKEREAEVYFSDPLYLSIDRFFVTIDSGIITWNPKNLKGRKVCKPIGTATDEIQSLLDQKVLELVRSVSLSNCFRMLAKQRVDLVPSDEKVGWAILNQFPNKQGFKALRKDVRVAGLHLILGKHVSDAQGWITRFNIALAKLKQEGMMQEMIDRHFNRIASNVN